MEQYSNEQPQHQEDVNNPELLKNAMVIYVNELIPEMHNLQLLKYDTVEMLTDKTASGNVKLSKDNGEPVNLDDTTGESQMYNSVMRLFQRHVGIHKTDFTFGEPSNVIKYSTIGEPPREIESPPREIDNPDLIDYNTFYENMIM